MERDVEAGCRWVGEGVTAADPYRSYYNLWVGHLEDGNSFGNVGCLLLPGAHDWKGQGGQDATGWGEGAGCVFLRRPVTCDHSVRSIITHKFPESVCAP